MIYFYEDYMGDVVNIAKNSGAVVICGYELGQDLKKFDVNMLGGNKGGTVEIK
jgi:hypothetical protein